MTRFSAFIALLAAVSGFTGVAFGAFAGHRLVDEQAQDWAHTGFTYQLFHTLACFAALWLAERGARVARFAPVFFLFGVAAFAGSLFALALGGPGWLVFVTPFGGVSFLVGWLVMGAAALSLLRAPKAGDPP